MGARPGPKCSARGEVSLKLPVTAFPVGAGAGRGDREAATSPLPGELHAGGISWLVQHQTRRWRAPSFDRTPTRGDSGLDVGRRGKGP